MFSMVTTDVDQLGEKQMAGAVAPPAVASPRSSSVHELSAAEFIAIVTSPSAADSDMADQRRQPRAGIRAHATIIPLSDASRPTALSIQVRDLSPAGIGFLHSQKMALDEQFALVLPRADDTPSVVLCCVAFWQPLAQGTFAIGARFARILRDGGDPALPIVVNTPQADLAEEIQRLHRVAS